MLNDLSKGNNYIVLNLNRVYREYTNSVRSPKIVRISYQGPRDWAGGLSKIVGVS